MPNAPINDVSDTALWVATFRAQESERPDALYRDPLAAKLSGERGREIARAMPYPAILAWVMAVRTVAIDRLILQALADGVDTVINLGAGLDTRPYRMDLPKGLRWVEVDFPHMIRMKEEKLTGELPRCELKRIGLDLSDRVAAQKTYAQLGAQARHALIITEGVIPYLSNEQAGLLADDLRSVASFKYWIQDYHRGHRRFGPPRKLRKKLERAPFLFEHSDPLAFFKAHGWSAWTDISALDEGVRLGRRFPIPFPWNYLVRLAPQARREEFRKAFGYVLFRAE